MRSGVVMNKGFEWKPFSLRQKQLLTWWMPSSPHANKDMVIATGAIRSGKTVAMIDSFITWSLVAHENKNFIIAGRSMGALKRNVLSPMFQILVAKQIPYTYHRADNYITIGSNTYYCFGAANEASQDVLQGLTAAGSLLDEVALMPESFVDQSIGRCSEAGSKMWWNCNPKGPNHPIKTEYIDKADELGILVLHFRLEDNLTLSPQIIERYKRMFSGMFYRRNILGEWAAGDDLIYPHFDPGTMVTTDLPNMVSYWAAIDYGHTNATTCLIFGIGADKRLYAIDEYYHAGAKGTPKTPAQYAQDIKAILSNYNVKAVFIDPSAEGFRLQLQADGIRNIRNANNKVLPGIQMVSSVIGNDLFRVHPRCKNLLEELASYAWDPKAAEHGEDKPLKIDDHCVDPLRYCVMGTSTHWVRLLPLVWRNIA